MQHTELRRFQSGSIPQHWWFLSGERLHTFCSTEQSQPGQHQLDGTEAVDLGRAGATVAGNLSAPASTTTES